ncbi:MAG: polysaccharide deacetylase family protein [Chthoniobacterales bacterium]
MNSPLTFRSYILITTSLLTLGLSISCRHAQNPVVTSAPSPALSIESSTVSATPAHSSAVPSKPSYASVHVAGPYIAMTFDDGPSKTLTPRLLDILKQRGIKATFFMLGENVEANPDIVKRIAAEGHEVANHSWSHPPLNKLAAGGLDHEIGDTTTAILNASGTRPVLLRPPYGATTNTLDHFFKTKYGLQVVLWSVDPLDWKYHDSERVKSVILKETRPGSIILSHDIHKTTVDAMPATLDALLAKGYKFVTVSQLIAMEQPEPLKSQTVKSQAAIPNASHQNAILTLTGKAEP